MARKKKINNEEKAVVYLGVSLPFLKHGTVIRGGLPRGIELAVTKYPEIGQLLVPINKWHEIARKLTDPHSKESYFNKKIKERMKGSV